MYVYIWEVFFFLIFFGVKYFLVNRKNEYDFYLLFLSIRVIKGKFIFI